MQHELQLAAWQMRRNAEFLGQIVHFYRPTDFIFFYLILGKKANKLSKCLIIPFTCTLTVDLQADCDVHGACYIHCSADICPSVLWDGSFNVQTAITPQEHPPIQLNLCR